MTRQYSTGVGVAGTSAETSQDPDDQLRGGGQSTVAHRGFGASAFGAAGDDVPAAPAKGSSDFSDQLGHSAIQTVRATMDADRNLLPAQAP